MEVPASGTPGGRALQGLLRHPGRLQVAPPFIPQGNTGLLHCPTLDSHLLCCSAAFTADSAVKVVLTFS